MRALPLAFALLLLVAGCLGEGRSSGEDGGSLAGGVDARGVPQAPAEPVAGFDWTRPHVHDYWGPETSRVVMDDPVRVYIAHNHAFDQPPRELHTHGCEAALASRSQGGSVVFTLPPGSTVLPGTGHLEAELSWSSPTITGVLLRYRSPDVADFVDAGVAASGDVLGVPLMRPMTDQGHERRSLWDFALCAWSEAGAPVDVAEGAVHVKLTIHKVDGPLPLDPGHPDHWGGAPEVVLGEATWAGRAVTGAGRGDQDWLPLELDGIVPWDAEGVRFTCHANLTGTPEPPVVETWYSSPSRGSEWAFRRVVLNATEGDAVEAFVPISADETDGVYGAESHWMVWFRLRGTTSQAVPSGVGVWTAPGIIDGEVACAMAASRSP